MKEETFKGFLKRYVKEHDKKISLMANSDCVLKRAFFYLESLQDGGPKQSVIYYGHGDIENSSILISIEQEAEKRGILCKHIKASYGGKFAESIIDAINTLSFELSVKNASDDDLTEMLVELGKAAQNSGNAICLFIDEVQSLSPEELSEISMAIHRCNQLRLPIMLFCTGSPNIIKVVGDACSYSERLYKFEHIEKKAF